MVLEEYGGVRRITEDYDCEFEHSSTLLRACHMLCCSVVCLHGLWCGVLRVEFGRAPPRAMVKLELTGRDACLATSTLGPRHLCSTGGYPNMIVANNL